MAETGWTDEFPQIDGAFYWRRLKADHANLDIGELVDDTLCCTGESTHTRSYIRKDFEYLGPVTAADFEQLTRLREAAEYSASVLDLTEAAMTAAAPYCARDLEIAIKERTVKVRNAITALREALAQRNTGGK